MDIQDRPNILFNFIEKTKRQIIASAFLVSFITLLIFIIGSYYFLFHYYERISKEYYSSFLRNVTSFQKVLIRREFYWEDLKNICLSIKKNRGVVDVWCTDRSGKLIYHTEESFFNEYKSKRLPSQYYESINHLWSFQNGSPEINIQKTESWLLLRMSVPVYSFGLQDHDFVLGMDVKRFISIPKKIKSITLSIFWYIAASLFILFFPLFLWLRSRFNRMVSQAGYLMGTIPPIPEAAFGDWGNQTVVEEEKLPSGPEIIVQAEPQPSSPIPESQRPVESPTYEVEKEETGIEEERVVEKESMVEEEKEERGIEEERVVDKESMVEEERVVEKEEKEISPPASKIEDEIERELSRAQEREEKAPSAETAQMDTASATDEGKSMEAAIGDKLSNPIVMLMDKKQELFKKKNLDLSFIQATSYVYHSKSSNGSYLSHYKNDNQQLYVSFSYPDVNPSFAGEQLSQISELLNTEMSTGSSQKELMNKFNNYCIEKNMQIDASSLMINEDEKNIAYASCGAGKAIYIKYNEQVVKDLILDIPALGSISEEEFSDTFSYAEIDFVTDDIFILLPQNASEIVIENEPLLEVIKKNALEMKGGSTAEIGEKLHTIIDSFKKTERKMPETGFVVFKFL